MGSWQMVLWQPRWVHATEDSLCYQKITADERPIGREKKIEFRDIKEIEELEYGEFVLQCTKRDYTFKAPDENRCQVHAPRTRRRRFDRDALRRSLAACAPRSRAAHAPLARRTRAPPPTRLLCMCHV